MPPGAGAHLSAARQAMATGLETDESAEPAYRDWIRIEAAAGNRSGLHIPITRLQRVKTALDSSPQWTEQLINEPLSGTGSALCSAL
ncbi:hypothetical protein [Streptomyces sp. NPDC004008]